MKKIGVTFIIFLCMLFLTACSETDVQNMPALHNKNRDLLYEILSNARDIQELYYEEVPVISHYSGEITIENTSKFWFKGNIFKTEQITHFYKGNELIDSEITGEMFDYNSLQTKRYYLGDYPDHFRQQSPSQPKSLIIPRKQTILWYLDKVVPDISSFTETEYKGEQCLVVEILKNTLGSTKVWIGVSTHLPLKIVNSYNGNISEREYFNFKLGKGSVSEKDLEIPPGAIIY